MASKLIITSLASQVWEANGMIGEGGNRAELFGIDRQESEIGSHDRLFPTSIVAAGR
jgi:hypothetical protein